MHMQLVLAFVLLALSAGSYEWARGHLTRQSPEDQTGYIATAAFFILAVALLILQHAKGSLAGHAIDTVGAVVISLVLWKAFGLILWTVALIVHLFRWLWRNFALSAKRV